MSGLSADKINAERHLRSVQKYKIENGEQII